MWNPPLVVLHTFTSARKLSLREWRLQELTYCRLLLRHAVERAQTPDQVQRRDAHDAPIGKQLLQYGLSYAVVPVVEGRKQHDAVGNVEVGVAGRQSLVLVEHRTRHRQGDYPQGQLVLAPHRAHPSQRFL